MMLNWMEMVSSLSLILCRYIDEGEEANQLFVLVAELLVFSLQTNRSRARLEVSQDHPFRQSRLACFVPHQSAIAVFTYTQTNQTTTCRILPT